MYRFRRVLCLLLALLLVFHMPLNSFAKDTYTPAKTVEQTDTKLSNDSPATDSSAENLLEGVSNADKSHSVEPSVQKEEYDGTQSIKKPFTEAESIKKEFTEKDSELAQAMENSSEASSERTPSNKDSSEASSERTPSSKDSSEASSERTPSSKDSSEASSERTPSSKDSSEEGLERTQSIEDSSEEGSKPTQVIEDSTEGSSELTQSVEDSTEESSKLIPSVEDSSEGNSEPIESSKESLTEESSEEGPSTEEESYEEISAFSSQISPIGTISSCQITGPEQITIQFSLSQPVASKDKKIYLFELESFETSLKDKKPVASINMPEDLANLQITTDLKSDTAASRLYSKFVIGISDRNSTYVPVSNSCYITNPEALAQYHYPFPNASSKKGLLINNGMFSDVDELGVRHALCNIELHRLLSDGDYPYTYNGKTYYLNSSVIADYDGTLASLASNNIVTTCVLLAKPIPDYPELTHPGASHSYGSSFYALNTETQEGIDCVSAVIHFLAERYTREDKAHGQIVNWIVGNEINNPSAWNETGSPDFDSYVENYSRSIRIISTAVKSVSSCARVYTSLDHYWNSTEGGRFNTVSLLTGIQNCIDSEGAIPWEIAHHPYPTPLTNPDFTDDPVSQGQDAIAITFKNLHVLTDFLQGSSMRNPDGSVKHVILSEQGFTSVNEYGQDVSEQQADMFAYAYYIIDTNPYIDSIILNRHVDHPVEVAQNINFGLWETDLNDSSGEHPLKKKEIWEVYKYIDTSESLAITAPILTRLGASNWESLVNGFQASNYVNLHSIVTGYLTPAKTFSDATALPNNWTAHFYSNIGKKLSSGAEVSIAPTYSAAYKCIIQHFSQPFDFSSKPVLGLNITVHGLPTDFAKVRVRMFSGENVYDAEALVPTEQKTQLGLHVGQWKYRNSVDRIQVWVKQEGSQQWNSGSFVLEDVIQASAFSDISTLTVSNTEISNIAANSYRVTCDVFPSEEISEIVFTTWNSDQGEENSVIQEGSLQGQTASCKVDISQINGGSQNYTTKIIAYGKSGIQSAPVYITAKLGKPVLSSIMITNLSSEGYTVTCNATSTAGITQAFCPTWTEKDGQDDIIWYPATVTGSLITCNIKTSEHNDEFGTYFSHIYAYDKNGNVSVVASTISVPVPSGPQISNIRVTDVDETGYTVSCKLNAYYGMDRILFPTWTEKDGQDDIVWHKGIIEGNIATARIPVASHNHEYGRYTTHIYAYDKNNQETVREFTTTLPEPPPKTVDVESVKITDITEQGYLVTLSVTNGSQITQASFATWTEKNGQDDLLWEDSEVKDNTIIYRVTTDKHNQESGLYYTHVYLNLKDGTTIKKEASVTVPPQDKPEGDPVISDLKAVDLTSSGYTVTADVSAPAGIDRVSCATWTTANGQDDIIWETTPVKDGKISYTVKISDHKNESGLYNTHVYLYDKKGRFTLQGISPTIPSAPSEATLSFCGHVQNIGWQNWTSDGIMGTAGKSLRVEAVKLKVDSNISGGIQYRAHVQNIGWQDWVSDGQMAGTAGQSLRVEALQIQLTGELAKQYDVEYRTHVQNIGWMNWVKNGTVAGTFGRSLRMEAVEIRLVRK